LNKKSIHALFSIACLVSGCGGGGGGSSSATATPPPVIKHAVVVAAYGDSTVESLSLIDGSYQFTSPTVTQLLQADLDDPLMTVQNDGDGGSTSQDWLYGGNATGQVRRTITQTWAQTMAAQPAKVIDITLGINDSGALKLSVAQFMANIETMVLQAEAAGKVVILESPNATNPPNDELGYFSLAEAAFCKTNGCIFVDQYYHMRSLANWEALLSDGIHPTLAGYEMKAAYSASIIRPALEKLENAQ
jgi:lysophospholipase L1-like esterase